MNFNNKKLKCLKSPPIPPLPPQNINLMSIISTNKRSEGRAEVIERKRREYLVRNSHNKMYLYNHHL